MAPPPLQVYEFAPYRLEPAERLLLRAGQPVSLPPKAFEVLLVLVSRAGHLVTKEALLKAVWPDTFVEEANITYTVSVLRKALQGGDEQYIETVQKIGYRFKAPVRVVPDPLLVSDPAPAAPAVAERRTRRWPPDSRGWVLAVSIAMALGALGVAAVAWHRSVAPAQAAPFARFDVSLPDDISMADYRVSGPVVSPDGRHVVFVGARDGTRRLWLRAIDSPTITALEGTQGAVRAFWSPDSQTIAFISGSHLNASLNTLAAAGGPVTTLAREVSALGGAVWTRDGFIVFARAQGPLCRVSPAGSQPEAVTRLDGSRNETRHIVVGLLGDGRRFVFTDDRLPARYWVSSADTIGVRRGIAIGKPDDQIVRGLVTKSGHLIYKRAGVLVAQSLDEVALTTRGAPVPLVDGDRHYPQPSASDTGTIAIRTDREHPAQVSWIERTDGRRQAVGRPDWYRQIDLAPSGRRALLVHGTSGPYGNDLWLLDLQRGTFERLTAHAGEENDPAWSPDEQRLAYSSTQSGPRAPFVKDLATGREYRLVEAAEHLVVDDWARDGRVIVRNVGRSVFAIEAAGKHAMRMLVDTPYVEDQVQVSPLGDWIAFNGDESNRWEVYIARYPSFTDKHQVSRNGGMQPRWRADGRELYYLAPGGTMMAVTLNAKAPGAVPTLSVPTALFATALREPSYETSQYDVTGDGRSFLILEPSQPERVVITFLVNWQSKVTAAVR